MNDIVTEKRCRKCKVVKPITEFHKQKGSRRATCKGCCREKVLLWLQIPENLEKKREKDRRLYRESEKRRRAIYEKGKRVPPERQAVYDGNHRTQKKTTGTITGQEWIEVKNYYGNKCLSCGRSDISIAMDHIVPLSIGGTNTKDNVQPLCKSCNSRKGTKTIDYRQGENHA